MRQIISIHFYAFDRTYYQGHTTDSFLGVIVNRGDKYYIGVSDYFNDSYDPTSLENRPTTGDGGSYVLYASFFNNDLNGIISQVEDQSPLSLPITTFPDDIGLDWDGEEWINVGNLDVDIFKIQPKETGILEISIDSCSTYTDFPVDTVLYLFDSDGEYLGGNDNDLDSLDPLLQYDVLANELYYVGIAGYGNDNFDPFQLASGSPGETGIYYLNARILQSITDADLADDVIGYSGVNTISEGVPLSGFLGIDNGYIRGAEDVDLYSYESTISGTVDIYTETISDFSADTFLRVFDSVGTELAFNNDASDNTIASSVIIDVIAGQTYYIGVNGASANAGNYNPVTGGGTAEGSQGDYSIAVQGSPPDNVPPTVPGVPDMTTSSDSGTSSIDNITYVSTPTFIWPEAIDSGIIASGIAGYQWRVDNNSWSSWQTALTTVMPSLADSGHTFYVRAKDNASNIGPASNLTFTIDTIPPHVVGISPEPFVIDNPIMEIAVNLSEPLDRSSAEDVSNYLLSSADGTNQIIIDSVAYDETTNTITLAINNGEQLPQGLYQFIIDGTNSISDVAGNVLDGDGDSIAGGDYIYEFRVGAVPVTIHTKGLRFYDKDNSLVTVKITKGAGEALMRGDQINISTTTKGTVVSGTDVYLDGINLKYSNTAKLTITAKGGNNQAVLGGITGTSLGKVIAKGIDLTGDIDLTGSLTSLTLDDILADVSITTGAGATKGFTLKADRIDAGVEFNIAGTVKKFQVTSFVDGSLIADGIGQVKIKQGVFGADITARNGDILGISTDGTITGGLTANGLIKKIATKKGSFSGNAKATGDIISITALGDITGDITANGIIKKITTKLGDFTGVIRAGVDIGTIQAYNLDGAIVSAGNDVKKVNIKKNILDTHIVAGYDIGTDCAFGLQETGGGDLPGSGNVASVSAKGIFARSYICAGALPNSPLTDTATLDVGLPYTGNYGSIGKVKFGGIDYLNATDDFGLFTVTPIKPFKVGKVVAEPRDYFRIDDPA